jgi:hypothetical protein
MPITHKNVISLLEFVKMDQFDVVCHFKCKVTNKRIVSSVPFEPYEGKIEIKWQEMILHPIESYNRYYHTPITIYGNDCHETIVLKAFNKVKNSFKWDSKKEQYVYN